MLMLSNDTNEHYLDGAGLLTEVGLLDNLLIGPSV